MEIRYLLKNNPDLFREIYRFNFLPVSYMSDGFLEKVLPGVPLRVLRSVAGVKYFSPIVLKRLGLVEKVFLSFDNPFTRAVLLSRDKLRELIMLCGGVVIQDRVRSLILKKQRAEFVDKWGEHIYRFVVRRAGLFLSKDDPILRSFRDTEDPFEAGLAVIKMAFAGLPEALIKRLEIKIEADLGNGGADESTQTAARRLIEKLLRHEVREPWLLSSR